jgi:hypothetical protein
MKNTPLIDQRYILLLAFSRNSSPNSREKIEEIYQSNQGKYYRLYKNSEFFHHPYFDQFSTETMLLVEKVAGIFLEAEQTDDYSKLLTIAKKMNNPLYRYLSGAKQFDGRTMVKLLHHSEHHPAIGVTDNLTGMVFIVFLIDKIATPTSHVAVDCAQLLEDSGVNDYIEQSNRVKLYEIDKLDKILAKQDLSDTKNLVKGITKAHRIKEANYAIDAIVGLEQSRELKELMAKRHYTAETIPEDVLSDFSARLNRTGGNTALLFFLKEMMGDVGIPVDALVPALTAEEWTPFLTAFIVRFDFSKISREEEEKWFWVCMLLFGVAREYRNTREKLMAEMSVQGALFDEEDENARLQAELAAAKKEMEQLKADKLKLEAQLRQEQELRRCQEKERVKLEQRVEEARQNEKELIGLRRYVFEKPDELDETIDFETKKGLLSAHHIAVIGGHPKWTKHMKEVYPDFIYFDSENVGGNLDFLKRKGLKVFFHATYNGHPLYGRVTKQMRLNDNPLYYLNESGNIERTTDVMCQALRLFESPLQSAL